MIPFSILDLVPVTEGSDARRAFVNMVELARLADQNRIRLDVIRAPRGVIFDRAGRWRERLTGRSTV